MKLAYAYHLDTPNSGLDEFDAEHERCTIMWDRLVDMDIEFERERHAAIAIDIPRWTEVVTEISAIKSSTWPPDQKRALLSQLRDLRAESWAIEKAWKKDHADFIQEQTARRFERIKDIRQNSGLFWPNYNSVIARYEAGRQVAKKTGRCMRHHDPLRDDAMLCVQIQRTRSGLGAAPDELPALSMISLGDRPKRGKPIVELRMRVNAHGDEIRSFVLMHRPLPVCRIKGAQVCRIRRGRSLRWKLILQCTDIEPQRSIAYSREGSITFDWSAHDDGGLIVARPSWRNPYILPADWMADMDRVEKSHRWLQESLKSQILTVDPVTAAKLDADMLQVRMLRQDDVPPPIRDWLRSWKLEYERWTHGRSKYLARRKTIYQAWAREIVRECPWLAIETKRLDRIAKADRGSEPNSLRQRACIHSLRAEIVHQANKSGATVFADELASGAVLTHSGVEKSSAWKRRKSRKQERSQSAEQVIESDPV